jgi:hypothetical protein
VRGEARRLREASPTPAAGGKVRAAAIGLSIALVVGAGVAASVSRDRERAAHQAAMAAAREQARVEAEARRERELRILEARVSARQVRLAELTGNLEKASGDAARASAAEAVEQAKLDLQSDQAALSALEAQAARPTD